MINTLPVPPVTNAASICLSYTGGGFNNWYLPSIYELELMYLNIGLGNALGLGNIGQFTPTSYWSSTEYNVNSAWEQNFGPVYFQGLGRKGIVQSVRAIRAF